MRTKDHVVKQVEYYGFACERSATGGYWVELDWDYSACADWRLFNSLADIESYLKRNGLI